MVRFKWICNKTSNAKPIHILQTNYQIQRVEQNKADMNIQLYHISWKQTHKSTQKTVHK